MSSFPVQVEHRSMQEFRAGLLGASVLFAIPDEGVVRIPDTAGDSLMSRARIHRFGAARCLVVSGIEPADIRGLRHWSSAALVCPEALSADVPGVRRLGGQLREEGFRIFVPPLTSAPVAAMLGNPACIGRLEFLLGDDRRLARFPRVPQAAFDDRVDLAGPLCRLVVVLDLLQDFEILRPFILLAARSDSPFDLKLCITDRVIKSHVWAELKPLLQGLAINWQQSKSPTDVIALLGSGKSILLMASESTAKGHAFCHQAARVAPPRSMRVCIQHGFECIGLRHHRAHDRQFPTGVRFESDVVFTWADADELPDLHPLEKGKCIPVGITKSLADLAWRTRELQWRGDSASGAGPRDRIDRDGVRLLVAENLHSIRFTSPHRYQRFLRFVESANASDDVDLSVRAHPAMQTLQKLRPGSFDFLEGGLTPTALGQYDIVVSAPSTIVLDAVLSGVASAVWSDSEFSGDCMNYVGLQVVTDIDDVLRYAATISDERALADLRWAVDSTCSLNGIPAAWAQLLQFA